MEAPLFCAAFIICNFGAVLFLERVMSWYLVLMAWAHEYECGTKLKAQQDEEW